MDETNSILKSIDGTLKRIEVILRDNRNSGQCSVIDDLRNLISDSLSERKKYEAMINSFSRNKRTF